MRLLHLKPHLSAILLSIFLTAIPSLGQEPGCEHHLTSDSEEQTTFFGAQRLLKSTERADALWKIGAPHATELDELISVTNKEYRTHVRTTHMVRSVIRYLITRTDWDGYQKAVFWDSLAVKIDRKMRESGPSFSNLYHKTNDGSFMFQGETGETLVITADGRIFRGNTEFVAPKSDWVADYSGLVELK